VKATQFPPARSDGISEAIRARAQAIADEFFARYWLGGSLPPRIHRITLLDYCCGTIWLHTPAAARGSSAALVVPLEVSVEGYLWWLLGLRRGDGRDIARRPALLKNE
jgi:hypothetical protein